jgi:hypothetical protein
VAEIAEKLFLSEGTVRNYLSAAIAKAGARNRTEAVRTADEKGWLQGGRAWLAGWRACSGLEVAEHGKHPAMVGV